MCAAGCPEVAVRYGCCEIHAKAERRRRHENTRRWRQLRQAALDRADGRCEHCGSPAHDAHHIVPRALGGADTMDNLEALCSECHQAMHR
jgi:5-methylcytosine-specific restriction endonuclease McrA